MKNTVIFLFILVIASIAHAQNYELNKELSNENIISIDSLSNREKQNMKLGIEMAEMYLVVEQDSFTTYMDGILPTMRKNAINGLLFKSDNTYILEEIFVFTPNNSTELDRKLEEYRLQIKERENRKNGINSYLDFDHNSIKFDTVKAGEIVKAVFTFKNISSKDIRIDNVKADCGCTATDWTRHSIHSQEMDSIVINYDTSNKFHGRSSRKIEVFHNLSDQPIELYLSGFIVNEQKGEFNSNKLLKPDTISSEELNIKIKELEKMTEDLKMLSKIYGNDKEQDVLSVSDLIIIDTISENQFILDVDLRKYYSTFKKANN